MYMDWSFGINGEVLGRIYDIQMPDASSDFRGAPRVTLPLHHCGALDRSGGIFEATHPETGTYVLQALSCRLEPQHGVVDCTPLGELIDQEHRDRGDDWLMCEGCEPMGIERWVEASSHCPGGDHMRFDVIDPAGSLGTLLGTHSAAGCRCPSPGQASEAWRSSWVFQRLSGAGCSAQGLRATDAEIIRLGRRSRMRISLDVASFDGRVASFIGHVKARDRIGRPAVPVHPLAGDASRVNALAV